LVYTFLITWKKGVADFYDGWKSLSREKEPNSEVDWLMT